MSKAKAYIKVGCPFSFKFLTFMAEAKLLDEIEIVRVREGDPATISFFAVPGLQLIGKVARIKPLGTDDHSKVIYTVVIAPEHWDDRLRWNMSAQVTIEPPGPVVSSAEKGE